MMEVRKEIIVGLFVTIVGGLVLFLIQIKISGTESINGNELKEQPQTTESPIEIVQHISLRTPIEWLKEKLGAPHSIQIKDDQSRDLTYSFDDFSIKINTVDNETIRVLTVLLLNFDKTIEVISRGSNPSLVLGEFTFNDIWPPRDEVDFVMSSKEIWVYADCYFGAVGFYNYYRVGIALNSYPYGLDTKIGGGAGHSQADINKIRDKKINFVTVSDEGFEYFWWFDD